MKEMRADSVLAALPNEQQEQLELWLREEQLSVREAQKKLQAEFGVSVSHDTVARYGKWLREKQMVEDFQASLAAAKELSGDWEKDAQSLQEASMLLLRQRAYETLVAGDGDLETLERVGRLLIRVSELELEKRRVEVAEYKAQEQMMAKLWAEAEEARPIWQAEHLSKDAKLRQALLMMTGVLDPVNQQLYEQDMAEIELRRCGHCQQVRPEDWEDRMLHEAKMKVLFEMTAGGRKKGEPGECGTRNAECGMEGNPNDEGRNPKEAPNPNDQTPNAKESTPHPDPVEENPNAEGRNPKEAPNPKTEKRDWPRKNAENAKNLKR